MASIQFSTLLTKQIIGCAMEVHRRLGPGLLECVYEQAMCHELSRSRIPFERQKHVPIRYRDITLATPLRLDLIINKEVIVEIKSVETILDVHEAQLLSYLRLSNISTGLLINFNVTVLRHGIRRKMSKFPAPTLQSRSVPSAVLRASVLKKPLIAEETQ